MPEEVVVNDSNRLVVRSWSADRAVGESGYWESVQETWKTGPEANRDALQQAARQALVTNRTYIGLASPTAAQTAVEVKALARQVNGIIRLVLGLLDGTD